MKVMKKAFALILTLIMACTMYLPVMAAGNHTLTINSDTSGHTYQAYQVFAGNYFEGVLSNVTWGTGVNGDSLLAALKADETVGSYFADAENAADVAEVMSHEGSPFTDNSTLLDAFANVVSGYLNGAPATSGDPSGSADTGFVYTISNLADGYYFVNEAEMGNDDNNAYTKFMLQVIGDTTVNAKADVPSIDKKIDGDHDSDDNTNGDVSENNGAVGDSVPYKVTSSVPDMDGYEKYFFVVTDTLSEGLTFNNDVAIQIGAETLTPDVDYTVETSADGQTVTITLKNFIQYKDQEGDSILITYSATIDEDAVIGTEGNKNSVDLIYSNNPNVNPGGDPDNPDKPGPDSPTGTTPEKETYTYVTGIELKKVDPEGNALTGAKFRITGDKLNIVLVNEEIFRESENGTYYRLKDGTYTTTPPVISDDESDTSHLYDSTTTKYEKVEVVNKETSKEKISTEGYVNTNGILTFKGLSAGEYTITELVSPDGYNLLDNPISITISWSAPQAPGGDCSWTVNPESGATVDNGIIKITVENEKGSTLPETGGIGTTIFYIIGICLMLGAGVLLVVKIRMSGKNR